MFFWELRWEIRFLEVCRCKASCGKTLMQPASRVSFITPGILDQGYCELHLTKVTWVSWHKGAQHSARARTRDAHGRAYNVTFTSRGHRHCGDNHVGRLGSIAQFKPWHKSYSFACTLKTYIEEVVCIFMHTVRVTQCMPARLGLSQVFSSRLSYSILFSRCCLPAPCQWVCMCVKRENRRPTWVRLIS
jgi:hypothetical protein